MSKFKWKGTNGWKSIFDKYWEIYSIKPRIIELFEIMEERNTLIKRSEKLKFSDTSFIYHFWTDCKYKKKCEKEPYSKLLENELLKNDYETFKRNNTNTE
jgi:hypothetical protein